MSSSLRPSHSKAALLRNRQQTIHDLFDFFLCVVKKCGHGTLVLKVAGPGVNEYGKAANHLQKKQCTLLEYSSAMKVHDHAQNIAVENEVITEWNIMLGKTNPCGVTADTIRAVDVHRSGMKMPSVALFVRPDGIFTPVR